MANVDTIKRTRLREENTLLSLPGVVGVGTGYKVTEGKTTKKLCMRVYVVKKEPTRKLPSSMVIPGVFSVGKKASVPTDVVETGIIYANSYTSRYRPAPNGVSIGHFAISAGTLGALAEDNTTGNTVVLSNNHVLANSNNAKRNDPILQPGPYDGGTIAKDTIAHLLRWKTIVFGGGANYVDAAIALPDKPADVTNKFTCSQIGTNAAAVGLLFAGSSTITIMNHIQTVLNTLNISLFGTVAPAKLRIKVQKCGRTTEYTEGIITDIDATVNVNYGAGRVATYYNQIMTGDMSDGGDSGSLVLTARKPRPRTKKKISKRKFR